MADKSTPEDIEKAVEAIYAYAGALIREGKSRAEVEDALVAKGIERATAKVVIDKILTARAETAVGPVIDHDGGRSLKREEGSRNMVIGGLICLVGIVITVATYSAASEGGGRYVVAWGAILFGAVRFFRGLSQSSG